MNCIYCNKILNNAFCYNHKNVIRYYPGLFAIFDTDLSFKEHKIRVSCNNDNIINIYYTNSMHDTITLHECEMPKDFSPETANEFVLRILNLKVFL